MLKIDHIGIAVSGDKAVKTFTDILGDQPYNREQVPSEKVETIFFNKSGTKLELLKSLDPDGVIEKFISKRGEGIHHIAFETEDIGREIKRLKEKGFSFVNETPKVGAGEKLIVFLHPSSTHGVLVEICQKLSS